MPREILIVDDVLQNRLILKEMLRGEYDALDAADGEEALAVLNRKFASISAVLLDIGLPGMNGYDVLRRIRMDKQMADLPVIMITGSEDEESRVLSLAEGANDYVTKPYSSQIIKHCLRNHIAFHEAAATVAASRRDKLTGLLNREAFFESAAAMIDKEPAGRYVLSCMDINGFKVINDQYGTEKGDEVLRTLADILRQSCKLDGGICGRISADHFVALRTREFAERSAAIPARLTNAVLEKTGISASLSLGRYYVEDLSLNISAMYDRAKIAQSTVKGRHDGYAAVYRESMREDILRVQEIVDEMRPALQGRQFEVWFQPQYNHATGAMVGTEALVRWRHPVKGLIPPDRFIPIFEKNGFIYEMDQYVWEEACRYLRKWTDEGRNPLPVSVNISRQDMLRPDLVKVMTGLIQKYELPVELLRLEVTESAFTDHADSIISVVQTFIERGFTVEIDDFGSGYSSLNTLKDVPAQILKLDMRFLENGNDTQRGGSIVESVVRMAKWLGMSVIAEGVETAEQADYLHSIGCAYMQGYYYAKPMCAADFETYCRGLTKEEHLLKLETVENLNNNALWDPNSLDSLIFNGYVGAACIFERYQDRVELVRATDLFAKLFRNTTSVDTVLKTNWMEYLAPESVRAVTAVLAESDQTKKPVSTELLFVDLPSCPHHTYLRCTLRVIAKAGERELIYCTCENVTLQREAEHEILDTDEQLRFLNDIAHELLAQADTAAGLRVVLEKLLHYFQGDRAYILEYDAARADMVNTCDAYAAKGRNAFAAARMDASPWLRVFERHGYIAVENPDALDERDADEQAILNGQGVRSLAAAPVYRDGQLIGVIGVNEPKRRVAQVSRLVALGDYIAVLLTRRDLNARIDQDSQALSDMMRDMPGGFARMRLHRDGTSTMEFVNEGLCGMLGMTQDEALSARQSELLMGVHPDDANDARQAFRDAAAGQGMMNAKYRVRTQGGEYVWMQLFARVHMLDDGDATVFCYFADLTISEKQALTLRETMPRVLLAMMESSTDLFFAKDTNLRYLSCTQLFARLAGFDSPEALIGKTDSELIGSPRSDVYDAMDRQIIQTGEPLYDFTESSSRKDGELRYISTSKFPLRDSQGNIIGIFGIGRDVTDVHQAYDRLKLLTDSIPGGIAQYAVSAEHVKTLYFNDGVCTMLGCTRDEYEHLLQFGVTKRVFAEDLPGLMAQVRAMYAHGTPIDYTYRNLNATGDSYVWIHMRGEQAERRGDICFVNAVLYDETVPREAEKRERKVTEQLSAIMDNVNCGISAVVADGEKMTALFVNDRYYAMFGYTKEQFDREVKNIYDLFYAQDRPRVMQTAQSANTIGQTAVVESRIVRRDGEIRWIHVSTSTQPLSDADRPVQISVLTDITEAQNAAERLRLLTDSIPGGIATYAFYSANDIRLLYCNDGFRTLFGGTWEHIAPLERLNLMDWVYEEDRPVLRAEIGRILSDGAPSNCRFRIRLSHQSFRWIHYQAVVAETRGDSVIAHAILTDVTQSQDMLEQLRISQMENHFAVQHGGNIVCRYNVAERSLSMTPEQAQRFGLPEKQCGVPEEPIRAGLVSAETADAYRAFFAAIQNGEQSGTALYQYRIFGEWRWTEAKSSTVFSVEGKPVKAVISLFDVTERLEKEKIYKKWRQSLRERPAESYSLMRFNLNRNSVCENWEGALIAFDACCSLDDGAKAYAERFVVKEDQSRYLDWIRSGSLIAGYYMGDRTRTMEYRELRDDGRDRWIKLTAELVESANSTDIEAYLMYEDIDREKRAALQTMIRAETDSLTGLLNRMAFTAKVNQILRAASPGQVFALMMLDIDGFKRVNDVFGHGTGDETLENIACGIRSMVRGGDMVARFGGDEFMVFLNDIHHRQVAQDRAMQICALSRRALSLEVQISGSVGIAFAPDDGADFETLYKKADAALYHVKGSGKNSIAVYAEHMADQHLTPETDEAVAPGAPADKKRRMLIVDDNSIDYEMLQSIFRTDFIIDKATDGNAALVRLRHYGDAISVVLLDLRMPGMNGFDVLAAMQESDTLRAIPVIVVSGDESRETCLRAVRAGATDFVTKPVDPEVIRIRVQSAVSKAENRRLRARNAMLEMQRAQQERYRCYLDSPGVSFIDYHPLTDAFDYDSSVPRCLYGCYDGRDWFTILSEDSVAAPEAVHALRDLVHRVVQGAEITEGSVVAMLKVPRGEYHRFRVNVRQMGGEHPPVKRLVISLTDLDDMGAAVKPQ